MRRFTISIVIASLLGNLPVYGDSGEMPDGLVGNVVQFSSEPQFVEIDGEKKSYQSETIVATLNGDEPDYDQRLEAIQKLMRQKIDESLAENKELLVDAASATITADLAKQFDIPQGYSGEQMTDIIRRIVPEQTKVASLDMPQSWFEWIFADDEVGETRSRAVDRAPSSISFVEKMSKRLSQWSPKQLKGKWKNWYRFNSERFTLTLTRISVNGVVSAANLAGGIFPIEQAIVLGAQTGVQSGLIQVYLRPVTRYIDSSQFRKIMFKKMKLSHIEPLKGAPLKKAMSVLSKTQKAKYAAAETGVFAWSQLKYFSLELGFLALLELTRWIFDWYPEKKEGEKWTWNGYWIEVAGPVLIRATLAMASQGMLMTGVSNELGPALDKTSNLIKSILKEEDKLHLLKESELSKGEYALLKKHLKSQGKANLIGKGTHSLTDYKMLEELMVINSKGVHPKLNKFLIMKFQRLNRIMNYTEFSTSVLWAAAMGADMAHIPFGKVLFYSMMGGGLVNHARLLLDSDGKMLKAAAEASNRAGAKISKTKNKIWNPVEKRVVHMHNATQKSYARISNKCNRSLEKILPPLEHRKRIKNILKVILGSSVAATLLNSDSSMLKEQENAPAP